MIFRIWHFSTVLTAASFCQGHLSLLGKQSVTSQAGSAGCHALMHDLKKTKSPLFNILILPTCVGQGLYYAFQQWCQNTSRILCWQKLDYRFVRLDNRPISAKVAIVC